MGIVVLEKNEIKPQFCFFSKQFYYLKLKTLFAGSSVRPLKLDVDSLRTANRAIVWSRIICKIQQMKS